eukprot:gene14228-biopygen4474
MGMPTPQPRPPRTMTALIDKQLDVHGGAALVLWGCMRGRSAAARGACGRSRAASVTLVWGSNGAVQGVVRRSALSWGAQWTAPGLACPARAWRGE